MKEIDEILNEMIKHHNNKFDELIKTACLKHGHNLDLFTKDELKKRCIVEIYDNGNHFLSIDNRLICAFALPDNESIKIKGNKAVFEYRFLEL